MVSCHVGNTRQRDGDGGTTCIIYNCIYDKCFTSIARIPRICKITEPMKWGGISQYFFFFLVRRHLTILASEAGRTS